MQSVMNKAVILLASCVLLFCTSYSQRVQNKNERRNFEISSQTSVTSLYVDSKDHEVVKKIASLFQNDIENICGRKPILHHQLPASEKNIIIIIGSIDQSDIIQKLIKDKKLTINHIKNKWEAYQTSIITNPVKGIDKALVITGSDRRGVAYEVFDMSQQIGVSPWYWWADIPTKKTAKIFLSNFDPKTDAPKVKYRDGSSGCSIAKVGCRYGRC